MSRQGQPIRRFRHKRAQAHFFGGRYRMAGMKSRGIIRF